MKLAIFLLSCLALSAADDTVSVDSIEDAVVYLEASTGAMLDWITNITETHLLNEQGTDFKPVIRGILGVVEPHFCPVETRKCNPTENWLFGCKCKKEFRSLGGECKKKPCQLFRHYKEKGPESLSSFVNADSYEEKFRIIMEYVINPISCALCECPGMIGASINCVRKYDGTLFEMAPNMDGQRFYKIVNNLDWKSMKKLLDTFVSAGCGQRNGKDCVAEISNMWIQLGTMLDNTFSGEDSCMSMIRMDDALVNYIHTIASFNENSTLNEIVDSFVDVTVDLEREAMCDADCAGEMNNRFYSCCTKHLMEVASSKSMRKIYLKLFKNIWSKVMKFEGSVPNMNNALKKYLTVYDLDGLCGDATDVYGAKNQMCDALEA